MRSHLSGSDHPVISAGRDLRGVLSLALAGLVLLAALSHAAAPRWRATAPEHAMTSTPLPHTPSRAPGDIRSEEVRLDLGDEVVEATVRAPVAGGPHPAMVLVPGAGRGRRASLAEEAEAFARRGIVTIAADKRTSNYSFANRDFALLAGDVLVALEHLRSREDVDASRLGLWGISEGGWVVPIAARRSARVSYVVLVSAPIMTPLGQSLWVVDEGLRRMRAPRGLRAVAAGFLNRGRFNYLHHDPVPLLEELSQPVLGLFGEADRAMPVAECVHRLSTALERGGNEQYTVRVFPEADHGIRASGGALADGYVDGTVAWVHGLADPDGGTAAEEGQRIAGPIPRQHLAVPEPVEDPWYGGNAAHAVAFGLAAAGFAAGPLAARASSRRRRGTRGTGDDRSDLLRDARRAGRWAVALIVLLHLVGFLAIGLATAGAGGPAVLAAAWLGLRAVALLALAFTAVAGFRAVTAWRSGWRPSRPQSALLTGRITASAVLLLVGAYWGLYAPRW